MRLDHITSSFFFFIEELNLDEHVDDMSKTLTTSQSNLLIRLNSVSTPNARACATRSIEPATLHPLPGDYSVVEPPDPFPNSEVKRNRADGSVAQAMQE